MRCEDGFTLIEMVAIIILLGILSVTAIARWPSGFDQDAARMEMTMAIRYAQHHAMTRQFVNLDSAWGITINTVTNQYSVVQRGVGCITQEYCNRQVLDRNTNLATNIEGDSLWFNGLGQPFDNDDIALPSLRSITVGQENICVSQETGYVQVVAPCP